MNEWQPIETAPKDGSEIIAWRSDYDCLLVRWGCVGEFMTEREIEQWDLDEDSLYQEDWFCADFITGSRLEGSEIPTHWMPLPEPPEQS